MPVTIQMTNRDIVIEKPGLEQDLLKAVDKASTLAVQGVLILARKPSPQDRAELHESGIHLLQYLHGTVYLAEFTRGIKTFPKLIVWAGKLQPEDKIEKGLWLKEYEPWAVTTCGTIKILVTLHSGVSGNEMRAVLETHTQAASLHSDPDVWKAEIPAVDLQNLAAEDSVVWVEQGPQPWMPLGGHEAE